MRFYTVVAALFAATAAAAPLLEDINPFYPTSSDPTPDGGNQCSETQEASCCNSEDSSPALGLECAVNILGGTCTGSVQCCDVGGDGGLIALNLCIPISA